MKEDNSSPANKTYPGTIRRPIFRVKISQPLITWQWTGSPFAWRRPPNFHGLRPNQRWLEATHFEASLRIFLVGEGSLYADCTNLLPRHLLCSPTFVLPSNICQRDRVKVSHSNPAGSHCVPAGIIAIALILPYCSLILTGAVDLIFREVLREELSSRVNNLGRLRGP
jgi:hypothetical protein